MPIRVVFDTNTLVSALIFKKDSWNKLRAVWQEKTVVPVVCRETTLELIKVFAYPKFNLTTEEREALILEFLPYSETFSLNTETKNLPPCRDEKDQIFLELALQAKAEYLITGDRDILEYDASVDYHIISVKDFLDTLRNV
jgi:uncharacterized protein